MLLENFLTGKGGLLAPGFRPGTLKIYWNLAGI